MFVYDLYEDMQRTLKILAETSKKNLLERWHTSTNPEVGLQDMENYAENLKNCCLFHSELLKNSVHFSWDSLEPPAPLLPRMRIEDVPMCLTSISARLPYPCMTLSFKNPTGNEIHAPTVTFLYEREPGLIVISQWEKRTDQAPIGEWNPLSPTLIMSTKGEFQYWDGFSKLSQEIGRPDLIEAASKASGYITPISYLLSEEESERDIGLFHIDLIAFTIPYIYLLNVKGIPIKDIRPIQSFSQKSPLKGGLPPITYKILDLNLPVSGHGSSTSKSPIDEAEFHKRLHLCRGHMKEYTKERPLFGKFSGIIWCPPHFRGDKNLGTVIKSYASKLSTDLPPRLKKEE